MAHQLRYRVSPILDRQYNPPLPLPNDCRQQGSDSGTYSSPLQCLLSEESAGNACRPAPQLMLSFAPADVKLNLCVFASFSWGLRRECSAGTDYIRIRVHGRAGAVFVAGEDVGCAHWGYQAVIEGP